MRVLFLSWLLVAAVAVVPVSGQTIIHTEVQPVPVPVDIKAELTNTIAGLNDVLAEVETGVRIWTKRGQSEKLTLDQEFQLELLHAQRAWLVSLRDRVRAVYGGAEGGNIHPSQLGAQMRSLSGFYGAQQEQNRFWAGQQGINLEIDIQTLPTFVAETTQSRRLPADQVGPMLARAANGLKALYWIHWYGDGQSEDLNKWSLGTHVALFWHEIVSVEKMAYRNGVAMSEAQLAAISDLDRLSRSLIFFRMVEHYPPFREAWQQLSPQDGATMTAARLNDAKAFESWDRFMAQFPGHPQELELRAQLWLCAKLVPAGVYRGSSDALVIPTQADSAYRQALQEMLGMPSASAENAQTDQQPPLGG
jgi:hypothetical protein